VWGGHLDAKLTRQINSFLHRCFKYGFCNAVAKVEQLLEKSDQKMFSAIQNPEHCIHTHPVKTVTDPSDQGVTTTNYQWLPETYIINRLFPVPFSNMYDDSFLVLGFPSVFCVLKFLLAFLLFLFMCTCFFLLLCHNQAYMFVVCFYNK